MKFFVSMMEVIVANDDGGDAAALGANENSSEFEQVVMMAEALRREFGVGIDAHPGGKGTEAGTINRAYRVVAGIVIASIVPPAEVSVALTRSLRRAAERRVGELDIVGDDAGNLLDMQPKLGEAWLAYLALAPASVIGDLMRCEQRL